MKKVLLLSTNRVATPYPVAPLGLALLYHVLSVKYQVILADGYAMEKGELHHLLRSYRPDYIGVSIRNIDNMVKGATHSYLPEIKERFIDIIHAESRAKLILGGAGFTIFPTVLMQLFNADFGIVGQAENSLPKLLDVLDNHADPAGIGGLISRNSLPLPPDYSHFPDTVYRADLDKLLDYTPYLARGAYPLQTKRGCVHRCIYCSYPVLEGRKYRIRNIGSIVDEIEETSIRIDDSSLVFEVVDSTFNDPPGHAEAICREIIRRDLRVNLRTMGMNPANITDKLLILMKQAGFRQIDATPDSASSAVLKKYGKNFTRGMLIESARLISSHQMPTMWFFIFGGPGETEATIEESFDFIDRYIHPEDMVHVTEGLRIYPSTPLARRARKEGRIAESDPLLKPTFYISQAFSEERLSALLREKFGTRPNCIHVTDTKPPPELLQATMKERAEKKLTEPMFRTLLRLKRQMKL